MNFWGFQPSIFKYTEQLFDLFLKNHKNPTDEYSLAAVVDYIINNEKGNFQAIQSQEKWHGITYKEDKEHTHNALCKLQYPKNLWS